MEINVDFIGSIDNYSLEKLKNFIDRQTQETGVTGVKLNIQSLGGSVPGAVAIYNYLKSLPYEIKTHNLGEVTSAAVLIYLAGSIRTAEDNSKFMIHSVKYSANGNYSYFQIQEMASILDADIKLYADIVNKETDSLKGIDNVEEILKGKSVALTSDAARKYGIVNG